MAKLRRHLVDRAFAEGQRLQTEHLWGRLMSAETGALVIRLSRRQGGAVQRNRFRRQVRGHFQRCKIGTDNHLWVVGLKSAHSISSLTPLQLVSELDRLVAIRDRT